MEKIICGIQQVGIGVRNVAESWKWYKDNFGFDTKIFGAEGVAERMLPYTGGKPQPRYAILVYNLRGGAGFEVWEPRGRELNYVAFEPALGDLGIYACKIKSRDVRAAYEQLSKDSGARILTPVTRNPPAESISSSTTPGTTSSRSSPTPTSSSTRTRTSAAATEQCSESPTWTAP